MTLKTAGGPLVENFVHRQDDAGSLSNNQVRCIYEDNTGTLWIGTRGGLNKFDRRNRRFIHFGEEDGLPSEVVFGILEDGQENLWISTINGLARFNPQTQTIRNFDADDGLFENQFEMNAYFKCDDGEMLFGGVSGLVAFYPDQIRDNPHVPPVIITDLEIANQPFPGAPNLPGDVGQLELSHDENRFSFEFAALDYTNPKDNRYAYMLDGYDDDWVYSGTRRYANYANLPRGNTFSW